MNARIARLSPFLVMDILREAQEIPGVVHMEIGEPDLPPPPSVLESMAKAVKERRFSYTPALGIRELREKIAEHYARTYGVTVSPGRIAVTPGTSGAFLVAYAVALDAGDRIALADPSYPCYRNFAHLLDVLPEFIPVARETDYGILPEALARHPGVKALHISSPANPTGNLYPEERLKALAAYCEENDLVLISDEIYHGLVYEGEARTALAFSDRAIVINGFSKYFCMPGFRLGWMVVPEDLVRKVEVAIQNCFISAPTLSQYAALGAFAYPYLESVRETFRQRRDVLYRGIKDLLDVDAKPQGAFYLWANIEKHARDARDFAMRLLKHARVAVTPGADFGSHRTERYIRLAYTRDVEELKEGIERIRAFLAETPGS